MEPSTTPTLKSIAAQLGLSIGTVQRALHNKGGYSAETQALVLAEAERCGYTTNAAAASLRRSPTTLAVILPAPEGQNQFYFRYIWQGIERACVDLAMYNVRLIRRYTNVHAMEAVAQLEELLLDTEEAIDGLITIASNSKEFSSALSRFYEKGIPVFIINDAGHNQHPLRFSTNVNRNVGMLSADILSAVHARSTGKLLLLGGSRENLFQQTRVADFSRTLATACPELTVMELHMYHDIPRLKKTLEQMLTGFDDIVGIYAVSARETLCMCSVIQENHLSGTITTVGTDVFPDLLPYFEDSSLTASIYQYPVQIGYVSVKTMLNHILSIDKSYRQPVIPATVVFKSNAEAYCNLEIPIGM